jgi:hypothetical protein
MKNSEKPMGWRMIRILNKIMHKLESHGDTYNYVKAIKFRLEQELEAEK